MSFCPIVPFSKLQTEIYIKIGVWTIYFLFLLYISARKMDKIARITCSDVQLVDRCVRNLCIYGA